MSTSFFLPSKCRQSKYSLQSLIQRKTDQAKQRAKYSLTEKEANLLLTHAKELTFQDGDVILKEGITYEVVYRVKSGKVCIVKDDKPIHYFSKVSGEK
jgi:CRP-like cAMP-binding protein